MQTLNLAQADYQRQFDSITEKVCLCEGLCSSAYLKYQISKPKENKAVAVCPGPNLAYFNRLYSLDEMIRHIYGQINLLDNIKRPHVFVKELNLYIDYLQKDIHLHLNELNEKKRKQLNKFKAQLQEGISYYKQLFDNWTDTALQLWNDELSLAECKLNNTVI